MENNSENTEIKEKKKFKINLPFVICAVVFVVALAVAIGYKIKQNKNSKIYDDLKETVVKDTSTPTPSPSPEPTKPNDTPTPSPTPTEAPVEIPIDFEKLWEINPDVYAWIEIPDTVVAYPVLQSTDDPEDYYLDHTIERYAGLPGSIYSQMINEKNFSDYITVIYGHNMINGTFFGAFNNYRLKEYADEHDTVIIYTPEHIYTYKIFACITYDNRLITDSFDPKDEESVAKYLESLRSVRNWASYWREEVEVNDDDKILTMSTCNGNKQERFLVEAVLTDVQ